MTVKTQGFDLYQGDDIAVRVAVKNIDGIPVDCTGYTATAQLRRSPADADASVDANFTCVVTGTTVTASLAHTSTAALTGSYWWDCQIVSPTGTINTIARGPVKVISEVTR